jgi:hypothetical protein
VTAEGPVTARVVTAEDADDAEGDFGERDFVISDFRFQISDFNFLALGGSLGSGRGRVCVNRARVLGVSLRSFGRGK